jgi:hypothetical protein
MLRGTATAYLLMGVCNWYVLSHVLHLAYMSLV